MPNGKKNCRFFYCESSQLIFRAFHLASMSPKATPLPHSLEHRAEPGDEVRNTKIDNLVLTV